VTNAFALLRLLPTSDRDKDAEILTLRHQIAVLERQLHARTGISAPAPALDRFLPWIPDPSDTTGSRDHDPHKINPPRPVTITANQPQDAPNTRSSTLAGTSTRTPTGSPNTYVLPNHSTFAVYAAASAHARWT
jgi:hypothetical protein